MPIPACSKHLEPKITFRIIRRCNFDCPGCCTFSHIKRKGAVRLADFKRAIDILASCSFEGILNISGGEPTFHKDLPSLIRYASEELPNAHIAVFTNGDWIGSRGWQRKLKSLFVGKNVLIRFSLDRQHAEGALLAVDGFVDGKRLEAVENQRKQKARLFMDAMLSFEAVPGGNFDFAFKGSISEAGRYMADIGDVPVYLIRFRADPANRPREYGFLAIDAQENGELLVYPTLGHIPSGEPLGGIEALLHAVELNRNALKEKDFIDEQHQWIKKNRN
ncbi:MAG: radical SAM protein [Desulfobacteraceae bacterium]|nr:radical SAM protein [Desulfobacteraceae bacterium]MBC2757440.1 radical SAM protein [Desulfobacteraceae bacterium]MBC2763844.1 radical SAM protein [ANME-2 cluster archaeon]